MAFGDCPDDDRLKAAWTDFCDRLKAAGDAAFKECNPAMPLHRADAYRFLTQNLAQAFDLALETRDPRYPALHVFTTPTMKLGSDCADFVYMQAWIDGQSVYRISGNRGTCRFLNFTVQGPRPQVLPDGRQPLHEPFGDTPEANLFGHQLDTAWDGGFELVIGGPQRPGNWLPTGAGTRKLFIRQGFDRFDERPAQIRIERIGTALSKPVPTPDTMIEAMRWAGAFMTDLAGYWPDWSLPPGGYDGDMVNRFPPEDHGADDAKRGRAIANMLWELAPDEALIVQFDWHDALWMFTMMGPYMTSMDYLYRPVSLTPSRTTVDVDGKVRLILAHADPGYHNWLDTQGFRRGHLTYRSLLGSAPTAFSTRRVKTADLAGALPSASATVTPEQRSAQLKARFNGIRLRYNL